MTSDDIENALKAIKIPYLDLDLVSSKSIKKISVESDAINIKISLAYPAASQHQALIDQIRLALKPVIAAEKLEIEVSTRIISHAVQKNLKPMPGVKNIIAVASGKGGVGKSTVSVNLALALANEGARIGILDADIYGPSIPAMLGLSGKPDLNDEKRIVPKIAYGIQSMSIGYLIDEDTAVIWRGPMVTGTLNQLLNDTHWDNLDYLIIDLPPGTGDIQLTLSQQIPVTGAVIVTTPQDIALLDAQRGLKMFEKVNVPVFGIVENMSTHICPNCGHESSVFGSGGAEKMSQKYGVELLGKLPLDISIREHADKGHPSALEHDKIAGLYKDIACKIAAKLSLTPKDYSAKFPGIQVVSS